ncbi:MAG: cell division protein FtsQ/DivIB, partial [Cyanobacteria bacterium J06559_3]
YVQERHPVAVTIPTQPKPLSTQAQDSKPAHQPGLLDSRGHWMAQSNFTTIAPDTPLPELKVKGFDPQYQGEWSMLYQALQGTSITVAEIDWQIPSNVILHTQVGTVHLGILDPQTLERQLSTLAQLRSLTSTDNIPEVEYIDLSNPETPAIKTITPP